VAGRDVVGGSRWGVAPTVTFGLNGPTRAILSVYHLTSHEIPDTGIPFNNPFSTGANVAKNGNGTPFNVDRDTFYGLANRDFRDTKSDVGTIDLRHEFSGALVLRNVTRYGKSTNDYVWTQPDDSKGNTVLYGTVWRRANTRATETRTAANVTSLSGDAAPAGIKHSYNAGVEFDRETTDRSSFRLHAGHQQPADRHLHLPDFGRGHAVQLHHAGQSESLRSVGLHPQRVGRADARETQDQGRSTPSTPSNSTRSGS
jgi:catecholate siderophore receptor